MDDNEFFDALYQEWSKTTPGDWTVTEDPSWMVRDIVDTNEESILGILTEADANFIVAMHTVFPEIMRRYLEAQETAERWEERYDEAAQMTAQQELRIMHLEYLLYATPNDEAW